VTVTGSPTLALNSGGTAIYSSGSGTSTLTFADTTAGGENTADLDYSATNSLTLSGGTIKDAATNNATLTLPAVGGASSIGGQKAIVVDTNNPTASVTTPASDGLTYNAASLPSNLGGSSAGTLVYDTSAPTVTNVTSTKADGTYPSGTSIPVTVTFSENVTVTGTPTLALNSGGTATYSSGSGGSTLTFAYTTAGGENTADLDYSATNSL